MGNGKTCDKAICEDHAEEVSTDKHLCPEHQDAYRDWLDRKREKSATPTPEGERRARQQEMDF